MTLLAQARLGCEPWSVYITERGSDKPIMEVPSHLVEWSRVENAISEARITLPNDYAKHTLCCEVLAKTEPFVHEVAVWRGSELMWNGPVWDVFPEQTEAVFNAKDILSWTEKRFVGESVTLSGDGSDVFRALLEIAYAPDSTSNPSFVSQPSGIMVQRRYVNVEFSKVFDLLQELSRSAVDYTVLKRLILFGGREEAPVTPRRLVLHDEGVLQARLEKEGARFATNVAVFGTTPPNADRPVIGEAKRGEQRYGLLQESYAELYIEDSISANANALGRVLSLQPAPRRLKVILSEEAALGADELIPGSWIDVRLSDVLGCEKGLFERMRLHQVRATLQVNPDGGRGELFELELLPLGLIGEGI